MSGYVVFFCKMSINEYGVFVYKLEKPIFEALNAKTFFCDLSYYSFLKQFGNINMFVILMLQLLL